eukprot:jgi/Mesen1/5539/ME000280S04663
MAWHRMTWQQGGSAGGDECKSRAEPFFIPPEPRSKGDGHRDLPRLRRLTLQQASPLVAKILVGAATPEADAYLTAGCRVLEADSLSAATCKLPGAARPPVLTLSCQLSGAVEATLLSRVLTRWYPVIGRGANARPVDRDLQRLRSHSRQAGELVAELGELLGGAEAALTAGFDRRPASSANASGRASLVNTGSEGHRQTPPQQEARTAVPAHIESRMLTASSAGGAAKGEGAAAGVALEGEGGREQDEQEGEEEEGEERSSYFQISSFGEVSSIYFLLLQKHAMWQAVDRPQQGGVEGNCGPRLSSRWIA